MLPLALLPASVAVTLDGVVLDDATVTLFLRTASATACCPLCDQPSHSVHSRYGRTVRDLPYQGKPTTLCLTARKFFCRNPDCPRTLFCERLPNLVPRYARFTSRLTDAHRAIALALGGEPGSRLAARLGMPTSPDTLLRRIKQTATQDGGKWEGSKNIFDPALTPPPGEDKPGKESVTPKLLSSPKQPFDNAGACRADFKIPTGPVPHPGAGKFTFLPPLEKE